MRKAVIRYPAHIHVRGAGKGKASWHRWVCGDGVRAWTCEIMRTRPESQSANAVSSIDDTCRVQPHIGLRAQGRAGLPPALHSFVVFGGYILDSNLLFDSKLQPCKHVAACNTDY